MSLRSWWKRKTANPAARGDAIIKESFSTTPRSRSSAYSPSRSSDSDDNLMLGIVAGSAYSSSYDGGSSYSSSCDSGSSSSSDGGGGGGGGCD